MNNPQLTVTQVKTAPHEVIGDVTPTGAASHTVHSKVIEILRTTIKDIATPRSQPAEIDPQLPSEDGIEPSDYTA